MCRDLMYPFPAHGRLMIKKNAKALPYVLTSESLSQEALQRSLVISFGTVTARVQTC